MKKSQQLQLYVIKDNNYDHRVKTYCLGFSQVNCYTKKRFKLDEQTACIERKTVHTFF